MRRLLPLFALFWLVSHTAILAQNEPKETTTPLLTAKDSLFMTVANGKKFVSHPVKAKQTLSAIGRYYRLTLEELYDHNLSLLKQRAESALGESIDAVTLGRPVKFSESPEQDRKAQETLRQAAQEAGFREVDFELEPIAAALAYEQSMTRPQNVAIFDFGGGTLDIAVMRLGDPHQRQLFASGGVDIAGSDFDRAIIEKRMLPHFGWGQIGHQPEILEMIQAVPDWMALPELATPLNRNTLEKAIHAGLAPVRLKALQSLIYNDPTWFGHGEKGQDYE